jgi:hypothetical protein
MIFCLAGNLLILLVVECWYRSKAIPVGFLVVIRGLMSHPSFSLPRHPQMGMSLFLSFHSELNIYVDVIKTAKEILECLFSVGLNHERIVHISIPVD